MTTTEQRSKRSKPRKGTSNQGQEYEIVLPALVSLRFFEDPTVENFVLSSNVEGFGCLDDLVITVYKTDNQIENYALQLKHKEKQNLLLPPKCIEAESRKGDFGVLKYCEDFSKIDERENYRFIIYTNAYFDPKELYQVTKFDINHNGQCPGQKYFSFFSKNNDTENTANIYNLKINGKTKLTDLATEKVYKSFLKKFAFYTHQKNWQQVQQVVVETFKKMFHTTDDSVATAYIDIFKFWKMCKYTTVEINREELRIKILDLILSPHVLVPTRLDSDNQQLALLETIFKKFDCVCVSDVEETSISKLVSIAYFDEDEDILHLAKKMKFLPRAVVKISNKEEVEVKQKIAYYRKEKPIILKIHGANSDTIATTITKFKKKADRLHFVLTGDIHLLKNELTSYTLFETLYDLFLEGSYQDVINTLTIFLNEKPYCYADLFGNSIEMAKGVTMKNTFEMLSGNFRLEVHKEKLHDPYIPRFVSINGIKIESIDEIENDVIVISHQRNLKILDSLKSVVKKEFVQVSSYLDKDTYTGDIVLYQDTHLNDNIFEKICEKNFERNVHHFTVYDEEYLEWISTKGSITEVKKCDVLIKKYVSESEIYERFQNSVNIVVANPGMGKTELLKKLQSTCSSDFLPIFITLKEHDAFFKNEHENKEVLDYFLKSQSDNFFLLEIKRSFAKKKCIIFFFDGIDELQHENIDRGLKQIKLLSVMGFKIWLSSRSHLKEIIEDYFNVFSIDLKSFTNEEQKDYIKGRLKNNKNVDSLTQEIFDNIDTILDNRDILDLPLQLFFITEILTEFPSQDTTNIFILTRMFQYFFDGRYHYFFNKCNCVHLELLKKVVDDSKQYRMKQYQISALKSCLSNEKFQTLNLELDETFVKQIQTDGDFLGIVLKITTGTVIFHHHMTATYFAALWFAENFARLEEFLKAILFEEKYIYFRLMFDMILAENFPGHVAALYRNIEALNRHKKEIFKSDKGGRSTLHLACSHVCKYSIIKNIQFDIVNVEHIKNLQKMNGKSRQILEVLLDEGLDLFKTDDVFNWNCFDFCEKTVFLLPLEIILEKKSREALDVILNMSLLKDHKWTILYYSAIFSYSKLFQNIFKKINLEPKQTAFLLQVATMWNSWKIVNILWDNDADIHTKTKLERTILHLASSMGHVELVTLLLFRKAEVNAADQFGKTPLHLAAENGHFLTAKKLLEEGAEVDASDKYGRTALHLAAEKGDEKLTKFLIDEKANINKTAWNGWGALQLAIIEGHVNIVNLLLDVDLHTLDAYGTKPLHIAAKRTNIQILKTIFQKSKNIDDLTSDGRTPLHLAAENGNIAGVKYLLEKGANINACDRSGRSVLHWAVIANKLEVADILLKNNVDVTVTDNNGRNCLQWATEGDSLAIIKLLLNKMSVLINEKAKNGSTALHWAAINGNNNVVNLLLSRGAQIDVKDNQNRTPLYWAASERHIKTVELLLSKNATNISIGGKSALEFARTNKFTG